MSGAPAPNERRPFTVSEITQHIKASLEAGFRSVEVEGEISNAKLAQSGHFYFSLKDDDAMIQAVMFRGRYSYLDFRPDDGMQVEVRGNLSVYERRGSYQIIVEQMRQAGVGRILQILEERKRRLAAEGLFDEERKKPIPRLPGRVGVVTSASGAAIRDILQVLGRRNAGVHVIVLPAAVQGDAAAGEVAAQIRRANLHDLCDVLIVGRGGGSIEDLLAFSDESVVREVAASRIPVISAVGHEVDWALTDFAADMRAPTPSAAAELVSVPRDELSEIILHFRNTAVDIMQQRMESARVRLARFSQDELRHSFSGLLYTPRFRLDELSSALRDAMERRLERTAARLDALRREIEAHSPLAVLARGYAIVRREDGRIIRRAQEVFPDAALELQLHHGRISARATGIFQEESRTIPHGTAGGTADGTDGNAPYQENKE